METNKAVQQWCYAGISEHLKLKEHAPWEVWSLLGGSKKWSGCGGCFWTGRQTNQLRLSVALRDSVPQFWDRCEQCLHTRPPDIRSSKSVVANITPNYQMKYILSIHVSGCICYIALSLVFLQTYIDIPNQSACSGMGCIQFLVSWTYRSLDAFCIWTN